MGFDLPVMNRLRRSGRALSPASLFATGAQGVIYDPRDLSTMFQDSAGTTPVTAPGQVVGLRLDKSKGLALGSELITNGDFSGGATTGWTATRSTLSVSSGSLVVTGTSTYPGVWQSFTTVAGRFYKVEFGITSMGTASTVRFAPKNGVGDAGANLQTADYTTVGLKTAYFTAIGPQSTLFILAEQPAVVDFSIDNISVRELAGNHAIQATAGARLTYGIEPKTGTRNLLIYSEDQTNAVWGKYLWTATSATIATTAAGTASLRQFSASLVTGQTYTVSMDLQKLSGAVSSLSIDLGDGTAAAIVLPTGAIERRSVTLVVGPSGGFIDILANDAGSFYLSRMQIESGTVATSYQKVVTAFEITEAAVPTCHYCAYAGANSMSTAAIDFTATDKMSVFAGVRKTSDAAGGHLVEFSDTIDTNNGSFVFAAPAGSGGAQYIFASKGTIGAFPSVTTGYAAPITNVITCLGDISGDRATLRVNGVQAAQSTTDQGTGNFGNYPLYIGRRAGSTLPFNGRDYGIVIVGKATSAAEINITEAWLAANTPTVVL